jgi:acyl carrier protein
VSEQEIFDQISSLLQDHFQLQEGTITRDLNFKRDLDADSIDIVEFVLELEDTFNAEIPDEDAEQIQTVGDAVDYIAAHQSDK